MTSKTWKRIALVLALTLVGALGIGGWVAARAYAQGPSGGYSGYQGCGMMGLWGGTYPEGAKTLTMDEAKAAVERSLETWNNADLVVDEVMEFSNHFYAVVQEKSTDIGAFEVLVDKVTSAVYPEPGPNMMWNLKYGMMGDTTGFSPSDMPVDETKALELAQKYLDTVRPGITADEEEVYVFYGYYTLHVLKDGKVAGMLSVNGYSGQVWYHTWHGDFVGSTEH